MALGNLRDLLRSSLGNDRATAEAALGTHVDDPVGALDDVEVVLDDDDRVALVGQTLDDVEQLTDVLEVQARGRLVEHVDGASGGSLLQLARELDALGLTTRERRRGLTEADVAEPHVDEGAHVTRDGRNRFEEVGGLLDRHVEDLGDRLALEVHLERLTVVARTVAYLTGHVHVGQEVHLDLERAVTRAGLAATALDVEGETARLVTAHLRLLRLGEELADVVENTRVRGRVASRGTPDGALIDVDNLVELLHAGDALVTPRDLPGAVELVGERGVEDVVDERRLSGAGDPGDDNEVAQREGNVDVLQRVLASPLDDDLPPVLSATRRGNGNRQAAGEVATRDRALLLDEALDRSGVDDLTPVLAGTGTDVDDPVGRLDGVLVVLDDDEGVAEVAQTGQRLDEAVVVALVETDGGLVEHVEHTHEAGTDLRGQADALSLATREGAGRPVEREVVEADVEQKAQASADLLDDALGDLTLTRVEVDPVEEVRGLRDGQGADLGDRLATDGDGERLRLESGTLAHRARDLAHVALVALTTPLGLRLGVATLDERDDALEARRVRALTPVAVAVAHVNLVVLALEQHGAGAGGQGTPGCVEVEALLVAERLHHADEVVGRTRALRPREDGPVSQRLVLVGHDEVGVDLEFRTEAGALGAGTERAVEGERARLDGVHRQRVVVGARELLRVAALERPLDLLALTHDLFDDDESVGKAESCLDGVGEALASARVVGALRDEAVDHDVDGVLLLLLEHRRFGERHDLAVDAGAREALRLQFGEQVDVLTLACPDHGGEHLVAGALGQLLDAVDDLLRGLAADWLATDGAVRTTGAREEQTEVVVDLRDGAHGGARVAVRALLVDRDGRAQTFDEVDVGLVHLPEELTRVRRQRLDVATLALGENRVERERRLARTGQAREDDERVTRDLDRDVLEVVLTCTTHEQVIVAATRDGGSARTSLGGLGVLRIRHGSMLGATTDNRGLGWPSCLPTPPFPRQTTPRSRTTRSSATPRQRPSSASGAPSTGCASPGSTPRVASPPFSVPPTTAVGCWVLPTRQRPRAATGATASSSRPSTRRRPARCASPTSCP